MFPLTRDSITCQEFVVWTSVSSDRHAGQPRDGQGVGFMGHSGLDEIIEVQRVRSVAERQGGHEAHSSSS
jgi:hypothetical protein